MARLLYCWRCKFEVPMLEEHEAAHVFEAMPSSERGRDFFAAENELLERYFESTGFRETNVAAVFHHQVSLYGRPCSACGKPLRTLVRSCARPAGTWSGERPRLRRRPLYGRAAAT